MLTYSPAQRISAVDAFNDPWIQKNVESNPLNPKVLKNIIEFYVRRFFYSGFKV